MILIALAADTLSIATMEVVDNALILLNRYLIRRGKGHTAVHETGIHGGPPTSVVGAAVVVAFVFGTAVLIAEVTGSGTLG